MSPWTLALRGLRHFRRAHLGVVLGCACATAVLVGALAVGDSVRLSLGEQAALRIGQFDAALVARERWFRADLASELSSAASASVEPVLSLQGIASVQARAARAGIVDVHGVRRTFFQKSPAGGPARGPGAGSAFINQRLAAHLGVAVGDRVLVRVEKPSFMPRDMVMASVDDLSIAIRVEVADVLSDQEFGRFGLRASQIPPFNVFVDLSWFQAELELSGKANLLLGAAPQGASTEDAENLARALDRALKTTWTAADAGLRVRPLKGTGLCELSSERIFLEDAIVEVAQGVTPGMAGILTYFVNTLKAGDRETPYSMVAAVGALDAAPAPELAPLLALAPDTDGLTLTDWLATDLKAEVGDSIELSYFVMGGDLRLREESRRFDVAAITPLTGAAADPTLMPEFPGLHDVDNCRDWEPGIPVDLKRIRDIDETYWDDHGGTPKAYTSLKFGQSVWGNRFGRLTALRAPASQGATLVEQIPRRLDPSRLGLFFIDLRGPALRGGNPATDFGGLFIGLSLFLIVAALLLTSMLFMFGVEQRANEIGVLLAVGFTRRRVRRGFLGEALLLAAIGAVLGSFAGLGYTQMVLHGLGTLWRDAVGATTLSFHGEPLTIAMGAIGAVLISLGAIYLALRRAFDQPATTLLASHSGIPAPQLEGRTGRIGRWLAIGCPVAAVVLVAAVGPGSDQAAGAFFGAGSLLLIGGGAWIRQLLVSWGKGQGGLPSSLALARRNAGRRVGRSLATVLLLASGSFLVVAVQAYRLEPPKDPSVRSAGTGGFALFGRSTLAVPRDLGSAEGREAFGIGADTLRDVAIVPMRVRQGDDASCLNLSRPQNPQLVSVRPQGLAERGAFTFASVLHDTAEVSPWLQLMAAPDEDGAIPAIGDQASVMWSLHKALGDTLDYRDESGAVFKVRIVGTLASSILQGNLLISEKHFRRRFPSASGYRMFLIDAPQDRVDAIAARLTDALEDVGLELTGTGDRLQQFNAVQNTYLLIFQALGGLGLLLGSCGLGMVVLRNALERRSELGIMSAVGWSRGGVRGLIWAEHGFLLMLGLALGAVAAAVAVIPGLVGSGAGPALLPMAGLVLVVLVSGVVWVWIASVVASRGSLLAALRDE